MANRFIDVALLAFHQMNYVTAWIAYAQERKKKKRIYAAVVTTTNTTSAFTYTAPCKSSMYMHAG